LTELDQDESGLMARAQAGDMAAFEALVQIYAPRAWRLAARLVGPSDAPDVVQQAFVSAWQALPRFRAGQPFWPWLSTIASNRALNHLRSRKVQDEPPASLADPAMGPEGLAVQADRARHVRAAVEQLPATARTIVTLHYQEDMSVADIGRTLGMGESAVKVALFRARQKLRAWLHVE
jgi:RNA polymerase sigma-70 factor (ECF subfamily)